MAYVNLWELITSVASRDIPNQDKCSRIEETANKGAFCYMQELSLETTDTGWIIKMFPAQEGDKIELTVFKTGDITISRCRTVSGIMDKREITF